METVLQGRPTEARVAGTCYAAPVRHSHRTEAVVGHRGDLARTPRAVVIAVLHVWVGHRVRVVGVEVIAALGALKQGGGDMWSFTGLKGSGPGTQGDRRPGGTWDSGAPSQRSEPVCLSLQTTQTTDMRQDTRGKTESATGLWKLPSCPLWTWFRRPLHGSGNPGKGDSGLPEDRVTEEEGAQRPDANGGHSLLPRAVSSKRNQEVPPGVLSLCLNCQSGMPAGGRGKLSRPSSQAPLCGPVTSTKGNQTEATSRRR